MAKIVLEDFDKSFIVFFLPKDFLFEATTVNNMMVGVGFEVSF